MRSSAIAAKWSRGARSSTCARRARARTSLEGLTVALANIDEMIELIKTSPTPEMARERMLARRWEPGLVRRAAGGRGRRGLASGRHAGRARPAARTATSCPRSRRKQILEMRLNRLTGLEQEKLTDEYRQLLDDDRAA